MFFKKKPKVVEAPLGYWEEKSYMMAIMKDVDDDFLKKALDRIETIKGVKVKDNHYDVSKNVVYVTLSYQKDDYEVGFYIGGASIPEYYLNHNFLFTEDERKAILEANKAITIFMSFENDTRKDYHLQLKLAVALAPDMLGLLDESAEKMLPVKWVKTTASSNVLPSSKYMFTVQAVAGEDNKVWLHTHGLCRCGKTELEILESDKDNYGNHYNLINTYAMYLIDKKDFNPFETGAYIGCLINGTPVVTTCKSWVEGIYEYKNLSLGGLKDRANGHNSKTSIIFLYQSEEDEKNKVLSKVSIYDKLWGDNPLFFITNEETNRMKLLAMERFSYVKKAFENKENQILIKVGLPLPEKGNFEHIWFELLEIKEDKFKAKLTQEPYNVDDIHEGDERWYTIQDVTDWIIYTPKMAVSPDLVYLLEE